MTDQEPRKARRAAHLLRQLLLDNPSYRQQWESRSHRTPHDELSHAGVAHVLALHLWDIGRHADTDIDLPRRLRDRVRRALSGEVLTPETLTWIIEAFGICEEDSEMLWSALTVAPSDPRRGLSHTLKGCRPLILPQRHRTLAVFERRYIDAHRLASEHRTMHVISATEDHVSSYPYVFSPYNAVLKIEHGGVIAAIHDFGGSLKVAEVRLDRTIDVHDTATLEYRLEFRGTRIRSTEVRRFAHGRTENVDIAVQFAPAAVPRFVHIAAWDSYEGGRVVLEEPVILDENRQVHVFWPYLEEAVGGLKWQW